MMKKREKKLLESNFKLPGAIVMTQKLNIHN